MPQFLPGTLKLRFHYPIKACILLVRSTTAEEKGVGHTRESSAGRGGGSSCKKGIGMGSFAVEAGAWHSGGFSGARRSSQPEAGLDLCAGRRGLAPPGNVTTE